jgi:V/A-type H+-transporting ATPase subunit E
MEMELKDIINKIKKDGVEEAQQQAKEIVGNAKKEAENIIMSAQKQKESVLQQAQKKTDAYKHTTEEALKQSARDALLSLRARVMEFFERLTKDKIAESMDDEALKDIIAKAIEAFIKQGDMDIEVLLSEKDKKALEKNLFSALKKEAKGHVTLKPSKDIEKGFRIGEKGKDSYLDFTDKAIADGFKRYLNPKLIETLDIGLGIDKE